MIKKRLSVGLTSFCALCLSLCFSLNVFSAPWVNLNLRYDFADHKYSAEEIYVNINGKKLEGLFEMPPIIMNNMTLVPAREVLEPLGAIIDWKKETEELYIACGDNIVIIKIGSKTANCNGINKEMNLAPKIINNKTMVPVRFVSEVLGFNVRWNNDDRTIYITGSANSTTTTVSTTTNTTINTTTTTTELQTETTTINNGSMEVITPIITDITTTEITTQVTTETTTETTTSVTTTTKTNKNNKNNKNNTSTTTTEKSELQSGSYNVNKGEIDISELDPKSLKEISFNDDFYYDRNMRNLVFSKGYINVDVDEITEKADKVNKKYYFSFDVSEDLEFENGYYKIDDEFLNRVEMYDIEGRLIICFVAKSNLDYKVYEDNGYLYIKPFK